LTKDEFLHQDLLLSKIKALPITIIGAAPLDEAISTTGGVALHEVTEHFELRKVKNSFCIGEMLDWNAPTGGYLLQACFSMGCFVARHINATAI
ncbi:MAG: NAD(P)/FAD-dependent oxidoreductase, partial [Salinivirgaceae bacterium]|nr:NAD(P)/FAD-dependent oxidoreductase [Salinivirgaceae bacterium]